MALAIERLRRFTEDEYLTIERQADYKSEFLEGQIFAMAGGSLSHNLIISSCIRHLGNTLSNKGCHTFTSDMRVKINSTGLYTYPDVSVVCGKMLLTTDQRDVLLNPVLVIEVLSDSTAEYDLGPKFEHYKTIESLKEYLLISQDKPQVERRLRLPDGTWQIDFAQGSEVALRLESVDCTLKLADIYDQVELIGGAV